MRNRLPKAGALLAPKAGADCPNGAGEAAPNPPNAGVGRQDGGGSVGAQGDAAQVAVQSMTDRHAHHTAKLPRGASHPARRTRQTLGRWRRRPGCWRHQRPGCCWVRQRGCWQRWRQSRRRQTRPPRGRQHPCCPCSRPASWATAAQRQPSVQPSYAALAFSGTYLDRKLSVGGRRLGASPSCPSLPHDCPGPPPTA